MVIALTMGNAHLLLSILFCLVKKSIYVCVYYTDLHKVGCRAPLAFILGEAGAPGGSEQNRDNELT